MNKLIVVLGFLLTVQSYADAQNSPQPVSTVNSVDLQKYLGKWYEIAAYPQHFQKGCHCTTAEYSLCDNGHVLVENRCNKGSRSGKPAYLRGKAIVEPNSGNAKMNVQFFWPLKGKYWIVELADDYSYAVVSHPSKKYLWLLSRMPEMSAEVFRQITDSLKNKGFDLSKLRITPQDC